MKTPKKLIEEAEKEKKRFEEEEDSYGGSGLYPHANGEDVPGDIIILGIEDVINAYGKMRKSCLKIITKWSKKHFDKDSGDYYINDDDINELKFQIRGK
ncbi:hypothetical protein LCGC14_1604000 [marine sediment metagenome]|uniref:Uncharacterized protein n=1 Tax=marine sediment metagenome TaxID=412755 RepID=A0A0F9KR44_9ZZZZ